MPAPHNFSGSVALNYGTPARNWTVNFTRDNLFFYDIFIQAIFDIVLITVSLLGIHLLQNVNAIIQGSQISLINASH